MHKHRAEIEADEATSIGPLGWALYAVVFAAAIVASDVWRWAWFAGGTP
jgi:hypothetical protein